MEIKEIQNLIKFVSKSGASEVKLETDDFKITIKTTSDAVNTVQQVVPQQLIAQAPAIPQEMAVNVPAAGDASASTPAEDKSHLIEVKSPMIGTFYAKPAPDKDAFVKIGDRVDPSTVVCTIEAMKLFNEIEAEVSGKIVEVLVDDATPVEYDQPLFLVDPS